MKEKNKINKLGDCDFGLFVVFHLVDDHHQFSFNEHFFFKAMLIVAKWIHLFNFIFVCWKIIIFRCILMSCVYHVLVFFCDFFFYNLLRIVVGASLTILFINKPRCVMFSLCFSMLLNSVVYLLLILFYFSSWNFN